VNDARATDEPRDACDAERHDGCDARATDEPRDDDADAAQKVRGDDDADGCPSELPCGAGAADRTTPWRAPSSGDAAELRGEPRDADAYGPGQRGADAPRGDADADGCPCEPHGGDESVDPSSRKPSPCDADAWALLPQGLRRGDACDVAELLPGRLPGDGACAALRRELRLGGACGAALRQRRGRSALSSSFSDSVRRATFCGSSLRHSP